MTLAKFKKNKKQNVTQTKYWVYDHGEKNSNYLRRCLIFFQYIINMFLSPFGFIVIRKRATYRVEQNSYLCSDILVDRVNERLVQVLVKFFDQCKLPCEPQKILRSVLQYRALFVKKEISNLNGGMGFNNGLILFCVLREISPKSIVESGVWRGYTTYLMDRATNCRASIKCFDIDLSKVEYRGENIVHFERDVSEMPDGTLSDCDFALFDDHVSHYDRLLFSIENKIPYVVLDDDVDCNTVHSDGWPPIPTAAMVFDYENIPHEFEWRCNGDLARANITGLDSDPIIKEYIRVCFPNLSEITGYKGNSYCSFLISKDRFHADVS